MKAIKAKDLTISIPNFGCDKQCPYCISRITGPIEIDMGLMYRNLPKVIKLADNAQVTTVLFTSKGEPLFNEQSINFVQAFAQYFKDYPLELQTNGIRLLRESKNNVDRIGSLYSAGFNTIAISVDMSNYSDLTTPNNFDKVFDSIKNEYGMNVRLCLNLTDHFSQSFEKIWKELKPVRPYVAQFLMRKIDMPSFVKENSKELQWIKASCHDENYNRLKKEAMDYLRYNSKLTKMVATNDRQDFTLEPVPVKILPDGNPVYDLDEIAITFSDYCIQETNNSDDIRSLIFQEDGHLYTSWNSKASIIF